jgi:GntR family transcriptional regulator
VNLVDEVRRSIIALITDETFPVGELLPNEQEMSERFEVSRATIREAYRGLIDAGYLTRIIGTGTVVSMMPRRHALDLNLSYTDMIREAGFTPSVRILSIRAREADEVERSALKLAKGDEVLEVERVRLADDKPVVYSRDRIPFTLVPGGDLSGNYQSLYEYLGAQGKYPRNGRTKLLPVLADDNAAKHLHVAAGTPLLQFEEVDYDENGSPVMLSLEWHTSDVFELWINRKAHFPEGRN